MKIVWSQEEAFVVVVCMNLCVNSERIKAYDVRKATDVARVPLVRYKPKREGTVGEEEKRRRVIESALVVGARPSPLCNRSPETTRARPSAGSYNGIWMGARGV